MLDWVDPGVGYIFMDRQIYLWIEFNRQGPSEDHNILTMIALEDAP